MGQIYFRQFYTEFVEHCMQTVCGGRKPFGLPSSWIEFTKTWLENLSEEDKYFVTFVFGSDHFNSHEGLSCFHPEEDYHLKRKRLFILEMDFAINSELLDKNYANRISN